MIFDIYIFIHLHEKFICFAVNTHCYRYIINMNQVFDYLFDFDCFEVFVGFPLFGILSATI